jgi:IMP dehydrogenase/GMP reductase
MKLEEKFVAYEGFTFDDVLLEPSFSEVLPSDVYIGTSLAGDISLNIPLCSSAMDTVTESRLAIAIAREGGIGIIHRNMSVEKQAREVDVVKRSESGVIVDPFYLHPEDLVSEAIGLMEHFHISGVPIVDEGKKLVGIITNRDLRFVTNFDQPISAVMTKDHLITASEGTTLQDAQSILMKYKVEKLPIVDRYGILKGLITIKDIQKAKDFPNASKDKGGRLRVGAAVGVGSDTAERAAAIVKSGVDVIVVDTAHGHSKKVLDSVRMLRKEYPEIVLVGAPWMTVIRITGLLFTVVLALRSPDHGYPLSEPLDGGKDTAEVTLPFQQDPGTKIAEHNVQHNCQVAPERQVGKGQGDQVGNDKSNDHAHCRRGYLRPARRFQVCFKKSPCQSQHFQEQWGKHQADKSK